MSILYLISTSLHCRSTCGRGDSVIDLHATGSVYGTFSTELLTDCHNNDIITLAAFVKGRGRISQFGQTQDIKMGSYSFQCDIPHQWIARQVGPVSVYCDGRGKEILKCSLVLRTSTPKFVLVLFPNNVGHSRKYNLALYFLFADRTR